MTDLKPCPTCGRAEPTVKQLVWHNYDAWTWWAESISGTYCIDETNGVWRVELRFRDAIHFIAEEDDLEKATTAAFNHHEPRVKECLV